MLRAGSERAAAASIGVSARSEAPRPMVVGDGVPVSYSRDLVNALDASAMGWWGLRSVVYGHALAFKFREGDLGFYATDSVPPGL